MRLKLRRYGQAGDTIVEVMASIAVMALALGAAYSLSNRSFHTAQNTEERTEALAIVEGQVEFLRNAGLSGNSRSLIVNYNGEQAFCFKDSDGTDVVATDGYCTTYGPGNATPYDIKIVYCSLIGTCEGQRDVFVVKATWTGTGGSGQQNLKLYFKPPS